MLSLNPRHLSQADQAKLIKWLEMPEREALCKCLESEMAVVCDAAVQLTMRAPLGFIQEKAIPVDALNALAEGARIKVFLDVLKQLNDKHAFIELDPKP